jgi:hypothetical protein
MAKAMLTRLAAALVMVATAGAMGSANVLVQRPAGGRLALLDRFLAPDDQPLISYRALRHLTATTRGGRMYASMDVVTTLDPVHGFTYQITSADGSSLIQKKVLVAALDAEQKAVESANKGQSALTPANYEFLDISPLDAHLVRVDVRPRRKHVMLVNGALVIESDSADLVRVEGELSQRPSFWTRRVHVVREYDRVGGVHVPVSMKSTADVLIVGSSSFSMTYRYSEINGKTVSE